MQPLNYYKKAAYEKAHRKFRLDRQAEAVEKFYSMIIQIYQWESQNNKWIDF